MKAKDYRQKAWAALKGNWGIMIGITLIYSLIIGALSAIPVVGSIAVLVLQGPLYIGLVLAFMNLMRGNRPDFPILFEGFNKCFLQSFLLVLLNSIFVMLWSLLFVIPGIIKAYAYAMSTYILADNPTMTQDEARKASIEMMKGNKWRLFCLHFSFFGWVLLSMLTFGILLIWVMPYKQAAEAAFYEDLKAKNAVEVIETVETVEAVEA